MPRPLNPDHLTPAASLNRVRIADLPGVALDPEVRGRLAYDLLSTAALVAYVRRHAHHQDLRDVDRLDDAALLSGLDRWFESTDPVVRATAEAVATYFGRALGFLLLALKCGDAQNRAARDDWDDSYWAYWHGIRRVVLGGGLVGGQLGLHLLPYTRHLLTERAVDCTVEIAQHPVLLPLIGTARSLPRAGTAAVVCDFGQSRVKRACAIYRDGTLAALHTLAPVAVTWDVDESAVEPIERAERLAGSMVRSILTTFGELRDRGYLTHLTVGISLASYIAAGTPLPRKGGPYAEMHLLGSLDRWLAARLSEHLEQPIEVSLFHDGTAAARAYGEADNAAVIMLGTAIGIGFPRGAAALRPLSPHFAVTAW